MTHEEKIVLMTKALSDISAAGHKFWFINFRPTGLTETVENALSMRGIFYVRGVEFGFEVTKTGTDIHRRSP